MKNDKYNPNVIKWEDAEEGEFRIVDSIAFSNLWATVRGNKTMTYEKLSRAMRWGKLTIRTNLWCHDYE